MHSILCVLRRSKQQKSLEAPIREREIDTGVVLRISTCRALQTTAIPPLSTGGWVDGSMSRCSVQHRRHWGRCLPRSRSTSEHWTSPSKGAPHRLAVTFCLRTTMLLSSGKNEGGKISHLPSRLASVWRQAGRVTCPVPSLSCLTATGQRSRASVTF